MKMNKISMTGKPQIKTTRMSHLKIERILKAKRMKKGPINRTAMNSHHHNHWRPKTTLSNKWASEKEEAPKWTTSWTGKKRKMKTLSGKIKDKIILATFRMRKKIRITSKAVLEEINLIATLDKQSLSTTNKNKKRQSQKSTRIKWRRERNSRNSCEK